MQIPPKPIGWDGKTTYTGRPREENPVRWADCPLCWRAGRIGVLVDGVYRAMLCSRCLGLGQTVPWEADRG